MRLEETTISVNYLALLTRLCEERSISPESLLKDTGVEHQMLHNSQHFINGVQYSQILKNACQQLADPTFALYYGTRSSISSHGILGFAFMSSQTLRDALILMTKYHRALLTLVELDFKEGQNNASLCIHFTTNLKGYESLLVESIISGLYSIFKSLFNQKISQDKHLEGEYKSNPPIVHFKRNKPDYSNYAYSLLGKHIEFDQEYNQIIIPNYMLNYTMPAFDPNTSKMAEGLCENIVQSLEQKETYPEKVRKIIFSYQDSLPTFHQICDILNLHPRTLSRRLKQYNTSYQIILDEVRKELALEYLSEPDMLIDDVAYALRFNDASSFYRAFKKWTGKTPRNYRLSNS